jgi:heparanase
MNRRLLALAGAALFGGLALAARPSADGVKLVPGRMARVATVDARFQSYNVEMVEVTGGRFWAPYNSDPDKAEPQQAPPPAQAAPGLDSTMFRMRPPADLTNARLRALAAALGPAYMRVSGSWANSTYFHDSSDAAPATPPAGFNSVLTRAQWRGVVEFAKATNAKIITSFAISPGTRDATGAWTPDQARKFLAYTASIGGSIAAAEFFNEPNVATLAGAPKDYDAAAYARDFAVFLPFIRKAAPSVILLGPGSTGEGTGLLGGRVAVIKSEELLKATGAGLDAVSYHFYGALSKRCAAFMPGAGTTTEAALSRDWLSRTEKDAEFYGALRDRFAPGKPLWVTETAETGCGGNPWASTFIDSFRYVEQLGRLAKRGVQVVAHNTLAASDYALLDETTLQPRPNYWSALLWHRLMGSTVLDVAAPDSPGVDLFAHCLAGQPGGVSVLAVNTDGAEAATLEISDKADRYTLQASGGLLEGQVELNGQPLALNRGGGLPAVGGEGTGPGAVALPPASITFLAFRGAGNPSCR